MTLSITQDDIRDYLGNAASVHSLVASPADGSPEIAWGDTFFSALDDRGEPQKMPFATIVTKDYVGFDMESALNRGGLYRLNINIGKDRYNELFGCTPSEFEANRQRYDFTALDRLFPHPLYGSYGWASIINPANASWETVSALLDLARDRALRQRPDQP